MQNIYNIFDLLTPIIYCDKGYNIIRKTFGTPGKIFTNSGICFKFPIIQSFDKVNIKLQVHFLNAHSVKSKNDKVIPYNITIDAQVEFRILDPMVIYYIDIEDNGNREPIRIYVDNEIHLIINEIIQEDNLTASQIQKLLNQKLEERNQHPKNYLEQAIKIERIVLSAFDYNLSIRHAQ
jgi:regulator of protease activity HflC (stomatin/prohibitin superfamily)|nr:MAG TPA: SPFH domain / Band 7 family [Bacteriophage sp.]